MIDLVVLALRKPNNSNITAENAENFILGFMEKQLNFRRCGLRFLKFKITLQLNSKNLSHFKKNFIENLSQKRNKTWQSISAAYCATSLICEPTLACLPKLRKLQNLPQFFYQAYGTYRSLFTEIIEPPVYRFHS